MYATERPIGKIFEESHNKVNLKRISIECDKGLFYTHIKFLTNCSDIHYPYNMIYWITMDIKNLSTAIKSSSYNDYNAKIIDRSQRKSKMHTIGR